ncbi:hypothetical protein LTS08_002927 [Lithohypha guttulata]|nr:hypothetical protein LTS08_002927 [Lithohypha guttulata]
MAQPVTKIAAGAFTEDTITEAALPGSNADHILYLKLIQGYAIRLVHLLPGSQNDPVRIHLSIHELEFQPEYEALSYVWGPTNSDEYWTSIECNERQLWVTKSLQSVFTRVRHSDRPRIVWADAICINQQDDDEKSHHVAFMNRIYSHASDVLVCMTGGSEEVAGHTIALLHDHTLRRAGFASVNDMPILNDDDPVLSDPRWPAFGKLMQNEWFKRAWVCQETGVAKHATIHWADAAMDYRHTMHLARWVVRCAPQLQSSAGISLLTIHSDWSNWRDNEWRHDQSVPDYSIVDFLSHAKGLGCSNAHDHIYAFLGHPLLQTNTDAGISVPIIKPDYKKSMLEIYHEFTVAVFPTAGVKLFSAIEHDEESLNADIPSWVVRWDMDIIQNSLGYYPDFYFRTSGPEAKTFTGLYAPVIEGSVCIVRGIHVDSIIIRHKFSADGAMYDVDNVKEALKPDNVVNETLDAVLDIPANTDTPSRYEAPERTDAISLTLRTGLADYLRAENDLSKHRASFEAFRSVRDQTLGREAGSHDSEREDNQMTIRKANSYWYDLSLGCKGRCFFVTRTGYYGLGPWVLQPGDECWLFEGARVLYVLRKVQGEGAYRILGEAYVHGSMEGEIVKERGKDLVWESVVLK